MMVDLPVPFSPTKNVTGDTNSMSRSRTIGRLKGYSLPSTVICSRTPSFFFEINAWERVYLRSRLASRACGSPPPPPSPSSTLQQRSGRHRLQARDAISEHCCHIDYQSQFPAALVPSVVRTRPVDGGRIRPCGAAIARRACSRRRAIQGVVAKRRFLPSRFRLSGPGATRSSDVEPRVRARFGVFEFARTGVIAEIHCGALERYSRYRHNRVCGN